MSPAQRVAAVLAAAALATPVIAQWEGWEKVGYRDPVGIPTTCYGHTRTAVIGKAYTADQCAALLASDAVEHGLGIDKCLPESLPPETRAAFISFAFNVGVAKFCSSTMARKAQAGDLRGACNQLPLWVNAGGKRLNGLVKRRADEQALCLKGLA